MDAKLPVLRGDHCRCAACGLHFTTTSNFDAHRTGKHGTAERRCRSTEELERAGWRTANGAFWTRHGERSLDTRRVTSA